MNKEKMNNNLNKKIKNPIIDALYEYLDDFNLKFAETKETFKKSKLATSDRKEEIVKEFFISFFPQGFEISRGEIFDYDNISNSIDCVIKTPEHPKLKTPMRPEIILAEGVYAAVEVKPDISNLSLNNLNSEFHRALRQCKSVKKLNRNIDNPRIDKEDDSYKKIPFILFTNQSKGYEKTLEFLVEKIEKNFLKPYEIPDIIFSLDGWMIHYTTSIKTSLFYPSFKQAKINDNDNVFIIIKGNNNDLLCILLLLMYKFSGPGYVLNDFIIKKYLLKLYEDELIKFTSAVAVIK